MDFLTAGLGSDLPPAGWITCGLIVFALGCCVGSFLNVVIYRVPLGISVSKPSRSFCPSCKKQIPFYENVPIITWIALRGKCSTCGSKIAFRYFLVELITGLLFLAVFLFFFTSHGMGVVVAYWVLVSLFMAATFIDFEHFIIPDRITLGGTVAGLVFAAVFPGMLSEASHGRGLLMSLIGAAAGYGALWLIVQFGKLVFGRQRYTPELGAERWSVTEKGEPGDEDAVLTIHTKSKADSGEEREEAEEHAWGEMFYRKSDKMILQCPEFVVKGEKFQDVEVIMQFERVIIGEREWPITELDRLDGTLTSVVIPREAMGFGDVKFMACIGAFLGWQGVAFTILAGSVSGAVVGLTAKMLRREEWGKHLPFGPYLVLGALLYLFYGQVIIDWYLGRFLTL